MIQVNGESLPFQEGQSIEALLKERRFSFPLKTVFVNGQRIPPTEYPQVVLKDGDEVAVVHLMSGG